MNVGPQDCRSERGTLRRRLVVAEVTRPNPNPDEGASPRNPYWLRLCANALIKADPAGIDYQGVINGAADEIERLRGELNQLREENERLRTDRNEWQTTAYAAREHYEQSDGRLAAVAAVCADAEQMQWAEISRAYGEGVSAAVSWVRVALADLNPGILADLRAARDERDTLQTRARKAIDEAIAAVRMAKEAALRGDDVTLTDLRSAEKTLLAAASGVTGEPGGVPEETSPGG